MPTSTPTKPDTVTISRTVANIVLCVLIANLIEDLRDATGWHILVAFSATARTWALILTVKWLFTRKAKRGGG